MEETARAPKKIAGRAVQRCIGASCGATYGLTDRVYVCSGCGGPLEIEVALQSHADGATLRETWRSRRASLDVKDRSGVWRYRELLPFDPGEIVTLFEGNTPLYDAPRCAEYCGVDALRLKHQGCNPTGSGSFRVYLTPPM